MSTKLNLHCRKRKLVEAGLYFEYDEALSNITIEKAHYRKRRKPDGRGSEKNQF
jgi:hypothetical protein